MSLHLQIQDQLGIQTLLRLCKLVKMNLLFII